MKSFFAHQCTIKQLSETLQKTLSLKLGLVAKILETYFFE